MRLSWGIAGIAMALALTTAPPCPRAAETVFTVDQLVALAYSTNPAVKAARERWISAQHQIKQAYAPNDPIFTYTNSDSPKNPFGRASLQEFNVPESFQFPGKAALQTDQARRNAEIARLAYEAQLRDTRAAVETGYYQLLLDEASSEVNRENVENLEPVRQRVDRLIDEAWEVRQEILQAALSERNFSTALDLAKMEYLPDFTVGFQLNNYLIASFAPRPSQTVDWSVAVGINVPIFFWIKQREDVERARHDLEAAHDDLASLRSQTAAAVTSLFRSMQYQYETSMLYRDSLTPLARQNLQVALIAYESGRVDFTTLAAALQRQYAAQLGYLEAANQFLAGRVALEQAIGMPLPQ